MVRMNTRSTKGKALALFDGTNQTQPCPLEVDIVRLSGTSKLLKLPPELSTKIWTLVIGNRTIHIESGPLAPHGSHHDKRSYSHVVCQASISNQEAYELSKSKEQADLSAMHSNCVEYVVNGNHGSYTSNIKLDHLLLKVCRKIYTEATPILWRTTTWSFHEYEPFALFMKSRTMAQRMSMTSLHLTIKGNWGGWWSPMHGAFPLISKAIRQKFIALETLHVDLDSAWILKWEKSYGLLNLRGLPLKNVSVVMHRCSIPQMGATSRRNPTHEEVRATAEYIKAELLGIEVKENREKVEM